MRYLYNEYYKKGQKLHAAGFSKSGRARGRKVLDDFFAKYVRGTDEIDYSGIVKYIGLQLATSEPNAGQAYLGADLGEENGRLTVRVAAVKFTCL